MLFRYILVPVCHGSSSAKSSPEKSGTLRVTTVFRGRAVPLKRRFLRLQHGRSEEIARGLVRLEVDREVLIGRKQIDDACQAFKKAEDRLRREAVQILEDADWLSAHTHVRTYAGCDVTPVFSSTWS